MFKERQLPLAPNKREAAKSGLFACSAAGKTMRTTLLLASRFASETAWV